MGKGSILAMYSSRVSGGADGQDVGKRRDHVTITTINMQRNGATSRTFVAVDRLDVALANQYKCERHDSALHWPCAELRKQGDVAEKCSSTMPRNQSQHIMAQSSSTMQRLRACSIRSEIGILG